MLPQNEQKHNTNQTPLQHIGNLASHKGKSATSYDSVNSLTTHNNQHTLLYPDLVQELFNFSLHNSNSVKNNASFLRNIGVNHTKSSSLDSSLSPRDILFFLQILSLYQLELSKGNTSITYSSLKLAKLLGADASCDTGSLSGDANMRATILRMTAKLESLELIKVFRRKRSNGMDMANKLIPVLPDRLYEKIKDSPANLKVSDSSKLDHESNLDHILKTKLFVPIELQFMKHLFKDDLPPKHKLFFLNCIMTAYRNYRKGDSFSFSSTSSELMNKNNISKRTLFNIFKYIKQQEDGFFIRVKHTYTKSDDIDCNRWDKSIFVISVDPLVFPNVYIKQLNKANKEENTDIHYDDLQSIDHLCFPDTYAGFEMGVQKKQPRSAKKTALNNKEEIIKNKYSRNIDENCENLENPSVSHRGPILTPEENYKEEFFEDKQGLSSSKSYNNSSFLNGSSRENNKNISEQKKEWRELRQFYPLSEEDVDMLNSRAHREFSNNFVNQLLLKLYIKYPEKRFKNRFTFLSYMAQILKHEKHQGPRVNHTSFRFSCNIDTEEKNLLEYEKYLSKIENSLDTSKEMSVKKKIAGRFSTEISYSILTTAQFIESSSRELLTILLPENIALSDMQREILMREVCSVYGNNNCYLDRVKTELKISEAVVGQEEENMEEAQSVSTSEPHFINPRNPFKLSEAR